MKNPWSSPCLAALSCLLVSNAFADEPVAGSDDASGSASVQFAVAGGEVSAGSSESGPIGSASGAGGGVKLKLKGHRKVPEMPVLVEGSVQGAGALTAGTLASGAAEGSVVALTGTDGIEIGFGGFGAAHGFNAGDINGSSASGGTATLGAGPALAFIKRDVSAIVMPYLGGGIQALRIDKRGTTVDPVAFDGINSHEGVARGVRATFRGGEMFDLTVRREAVGERGKSYGVVAGFHPHGDKGLLIEGETRFIDIEREDKRLPAGPGNMDMSGFELNLTAGTAWDL